ncbi:MAG: hypothetical protein IKA08_02135 [Alphaproteobacteria bacterium]|nr:hypothetical protein [Alphaproteobacteria bacterium]
MKKIFILCSGLILAPSTGWTGAVSAYIAGSCGGIQSNSSMQLLCDDPIQSCTSTGVGVITDGTYKNYDNCVVNSANVILCFEDTTDGALACQLLKKGGCHSDYVGNLVSGPTTSASGTGRTTKVYTEQLECCQSTTCSGYSDGTTLSAAPGALYSHPKSCGTDGTCSDLARGIVTCAKGYFSAAGTDYTSVSSSENPATKAIALECTSCATYTNETDATTAGLRSTSASSCYVPAGHSETDTTGTWQFTANCNYTP